MEASCSRCRQGGGTLVENGKNNTRAGIVRTCTVLAYLHRASDHPKKQARLPAVPVSTSLWNVIKRLMVCMKAS